MTRPESRLRILLPVLAGACLLVGGLVVWNHLQKPEELAPLAKVDPFARLNLDDPQPSYLMLRYVCERGGDKTTRRLAISWLDEQTRKRKPLPHARQEWLLDMVQSGGHPDWDIEARLWILNSAFNVLHLGSGHEELTRLLVKLATTHPSKTMRLYALQHIDAQRSIGKLSGAMAEEARAILWEIASDPRSKVSGTALIALIRWDGPDQTPEQTLLDLAVQLVADPERPVDIRVTALHASGERSLPLARQLASETNHPIHLCKATIANIGKYGNQSDIAVLEELERENFRIAQAVTPAMKGIRHRALNHRPRQLIPF